MGIIQVRDHLLPGVSLIDCPFYPDKRGSLTKIYHSASLDQYGLHFTPAETFITTSFAGVLRGMHFQVGTSAHDKLVFCLAGRVLDVVVDVRRSSPYFNKPISIELKHDKPIALLIGKGFAHGFFALEDNSCMLYSTSTVHKPEHDRGVLWSSIDFDWPIMTPLLSHRDQQHPSIHSLE